MVAPLDAAQELGVSSRDPSGVRSEGGEGRGDGVFQRAKDEECESANVAKVPSEWRRTTRVFSSAEAWRGRRAEVAANCIGDM